MKTWIIVDAHGHPLARCKCRPSKRFPCMFPLHYSNKATPFGSYKEAHKMLKALRKVNERVWAHHEVPRGQRVHIIGVKG